MRDAIRFITATGAALAALNVFLLGYPGDALPQAWLLGVGGASAFVTAMAAYLNDGR